MPRKQVVDAVEARLAAEWSSTPVVGMNTQGEAPSDGSDFVVVQYPLANTSRLSVTDPHYQEEGGIRFVLHTQRGLGIVGALATADELADLFRDQEFDGVETQVPSSPVLNDDNDQGNFFTLSFVVPYSYQWQDA